MDIDDLINILEQAKAAELKKVQILVKDDYIDLTFSANDISGFSYSFDNDVIILLPQYI